VCVCVETGLLAFSHCWCVRTGLWNSQGEQDTILSSEVFAIAAIEQTEIKFTFSICIANFRGPINLLRLILEKGGNAQATNEDGWTPLHLSSRYDCHCVLNLLLAIDLACHLARGIGLLCIPMSCNENVRNAPIIVSGGTCLAWFASVFTHKYVKNMIRGCQKKNFVSLLLHFGLTSFLRFNLHSGLGRRTVPLH